MQTHQFLNFTNPYIPLMEEFRPWLVEEELALKQKGNWREGPTRIFPHLDVEIGTGNGFYFSHHAKTYSERALVGFEIKFKTSVQSIRRCVRQGCENARMIKADAKDLRLFFAPDEIDQLFIHFPDPWPKPRQQKNRILDDVFLKNTFEVIKPGGLIEFKTDHYDYFKAAALCAARSAFDLVFYTEDLHHSFLSDKNFVTQFESLFLRKKQPIFLFHLKKPLH